MLARRFRCEAPVRQHLMRMAGADPKLRKKAEDDIKAEKAKVRALYRKVLSRDPSAKEMDLALGYLAQGTMEQYAQVLLSTNEEIFWP